MRQKILKASDLAWSYYKKAKDKIEFGLKGGEYGAGQNERVKRYRERGEKLNEQWTK